MPSPRATPPRRNARSNQGWRRYAKRFRGALRGRWLRQRWSAAPIALRILAIAAAFLIGLPLANLAWQVLRKPTELFVVIGHKLDKQPAETWRAYGAHFRTFSTDSISAELLAALAQTESSGNPVTRTYWRFRWGWNPLALYKPASSAVGLLQMTDPAFAEASRFCIRGHQAVSDCWLTSLYFRTLPSHAIELGSIYLDRQMAGVLASAPGKGASAQQKQDLAALIHLCGARPARAFSRRGFKPLPGERCGDHLVSLYLAKVNVMAQQFARLAKAGA
ncbi:MAG: lytic transglycosylase domain-containing protein [Bradyrhizobiaceae bacterium]|nr:MAG: lytic transglycosylase domain-containing protein [Bradyrhizobiaceae bacterium]